MKSIILLVTALVASVATASSRGKCFQEPFPQLLEHQITNYRKCGLNNPFVMNFVCEPIRGLVPDAVYYQWHAERNPQEFATGSPVIPMHSIEESIDQAGVLSAAPAARSQRSSTSSGSSAQQWATNYAKLRAAGFIGERSS